MQARDELASSSDELTVDKLINTLVQSKTTGTEKPGTSQIIVKYSTSFPFMFLWLHQAKLAGGRTHCVLRLSIYFNGSQQKGIMSMKPVFEKITKIQAQKCNVDIQHLCF